MACLAFKLCLSALLTLWLCSVAYAADIDLEISSGMGYDSNVFRSAASPKQDVYFKLAPEIAFILPFYKAYFSLSSQGNFQQNLSQTDASLQELILSVLGRYRLSDRMSFGLQDKLVISDLLKSAERLTDVPGRRKFVSNRLSSDFRHELREGVLALSLGYSNDVRDYRGKAKLDDWMSHTGQLQVDYFLGYKTSTQLLFGLTKKVYEADVDYVSIPVTASLKRKLSDKLDATLSLGLKNRRYDEPYGDRNWDEPGVSFVITGRFTPKTVSSLAFQRDVYDSDLIVGDAFVSKAGLLTLTLNLSDAAQLTLDGLYSRNDYTLFKWTSDVYEGRVTIQYRLVRWGSVALSYGYEKWITNFLDILGYDYDKHVIDLSYVMTF